MKSQHPRGGFLRCILLASVGSLVLLVGSTTATAQCAYPALELLEFDYVNPPQMTRADEQKAGNVYLTVENPPKIEYEFQGRLLVWNTLLRWLHLDAAAEAWTPLPQ